MHDDFDVERLAEIPDPFADEARAPVRGAGSRRVVSATRSRVKALRSVAAAGAIAYEMGWLALAGMRPGLDSASASAVAVGLLIPLAAVAIAWSAVTLRGPRALATTWPAAWVAAPPLLFGLLTLAANPRASEGSPFWGGALRCMIQTMILTVGPLALGALAYRHAFVTASRWRTAALGVACGGLSTATICLSCPDQTALHVIVGHGTAMVVGGLAGGVLGYRLTRV
ncbi:MAG TPA: NrsF family protein [Polyangiaceae bacterium]|nr:NrsF family protein [Polyangiaceae bacterium]